MITYSDIIKLFSFQSEEDFCIEIEFSVNGYPEYQSCFMGKTPNKTEKNKWIFWYGLASDGTKSFNYDNIDDFSAAPIFDGKSLKEIFSKINILSIDGCDPEYRINFYIS